MKDIPTIEKEIKQIIESAICKRFRMSPIEKSKRVYADVKIKFERIQKLRDKELHLTLLPTKELREEK